MNARRQESEVWPSRVYGSLRAVSSSSETTVDVALTTGCLPLERRFGNDHDAFGDDLHPNLAFVVSRVKPPAQLFRLFVGSTPNCHLALARLIIDDQWRSGLTG